MPANQRRPLLYGKRRKGGFNRFVPAPAEVQLRHSFNRRLCCRVWNSIRKSEGISGVVRQCVI